MSRAGGGGDVSTQAAMDAVLRVVQARGDEGIDTAALQEKLPDLTADAIATGINALLRAFRLQVFQRQDAPPVYKHVPKEEAAKMKGMSAEDMLVYQLVAEAGNTGIWSRDIKNKSNLQQPQVTRILKELEKRQLIKAVRTVESANRKVYMLFDLEPAQAVTGGAWYTDQSLDQEFIERARDICLQLIERSNGSMSVEQITSFIRQSQVFHVNLTENDVVVIMNTLVYDGLVDDVEEDGIDVYRLARRAPVVSALGSIPCGVCPVIHQCAPDGPVSPATCEYFKAWLEF